MGKRVFISALFLILISSLAVAETIYFKSGETQEGEIVERSDEYIKVDIGIGVPIMYFLDDIKSIDTENLALDADNLKTREAEELFKQGTSLIKNGKYTLAVNKLQDCIKANPNHMGCSCNLAVAYAYTDQTDKAIEKLEEVIYKEPPASRSILFYNLGNLYKQNGNEQEAENNYSNSIYLTPYFAQPYMKLGWIYFKRNNQEQANNYFAKGNYMDSFMPDLIPENIERTVGYIMVSTDETSLPDLYLYQSPAWHLSLAINYLNKNEIDNSRKEIEKAILALDKKSPLQSDKSAFVEVHLYQGNTYLREDNLDKALEEYLIAYDIDQKHIGAILNVGMTYFLKGHYNTATEYYQMAVEVDPNFPGTITLKEALAQKVNIGVTFGSPQMAIGWWKAAIEDNPDDFVAYNKLGLAYAELGQFQEAIDCFKKANEINPNHAESYAYIGATYNSLEQPEQAIPYLEKAIELGSEDWQTYSSLAGSYFFTDRFSEAIPYFKKAIQLNPGDTKQYIGLANAYKELGQYQQAKENYLKLKELFQQQGNQDGVQHIEELLKELPEVKEQFK